MCGLNTISGAIVDSAIQVHNALGPGLLESVYEVCLRHELQSRGFKVFNQVALPIVYKGVRLDAGYRMDLLVQDSMIVELKALEKLQPIHEVQLLSYLRLSGKQLGLLINFKHVRLRDGIRRIVNGLSE